MIQSLRTRLAPGLVACMNRRFSGLSDRKIVQLEPGLLMIKEGICFTEQIALSKIALELGEKGFWRTDDNGVRILNSAPHRGRMYEAVKSFPHIMADLCQRSIHLASKTDTAIKTVQATHLILLYYKTLPEAPVKEYIPWHQDNGENDGEDDFPIVSFNIGDSCDFLVSHGKPKTNSSHPLDNPINLAHRILFESGDVLIFGGPCRHIWHTIYKIHKNTSPGFLPFKDARLNFTFRYTPKILGDEARFATKPADKLPMDNQFYKLTKMK